METKGSSINFDQWGSRKSNELNVLHEIAPEVIYLDAEKIGIARNFKYIVTS